MFYALSTILAHGPLLVVCVAGIALGLIHREKAPRTMMALVVSLAAILALDLTSPIVERIIYGAFGSQQQGGLIVSNLLGFWWVVRALLTTAAIAGLVFAALDGRGIPLDASAFTPNPSRMP